MKKIIALTLAFIMAFSLFSTTAFAGGGEDVNYEIAYKLKQLNLFQGVSDTDFALDRAPTRVEAIVMLIRVLGVENDAYHQNHSHPFTDVPSWANYYVGYAYANGLTNGISATKFGAAQAANAQMYLTFVLRALGFSDKGGLDFTWQDPFTLAENLGLMAGHPNLDNFLRADVARVSYAALNVCLKGQTTRLIDKLFNSHVFGDEEYNNVYDPNFLDVLFEDYVEPEKYAGISNYSSLTDATAAYVSQNFGDPTLVEATDFDGAPIKLNFFDDYFLATTTKKMGEYKYEITLKFSENRAETECTVQCGYVDPSAHGDIAGFAQLAFPFAKSAYMPNMHDTVRLNMIPLDDLDTHINNITTALNALLAISDIEMTSNLGITGESFLYRIGFESFNY